MYANQIENAMRSAPVSNPDIFRGVFARDELPRQFLKPPFAMIVNTDPSTEEGEHWLAFYCSSYREGLEIFCSYASLSILPLYKEFIQFLKRQKIFAYMYNTMPIQAPCSATCGFYSIGFLIARMNAITCEDFVNFFSVHDFQSNDVYIIDFIERVCTVWPLFTRKQKKRIKKDVEKCYRNLI